MCNVVSYYPCHLGLRNWYELICIKWNVSNIFEGSSLIRQRNCLDLSVGQKKFRLQPPTIPLPPKVNLSVIQRDSDSKVIPCHIWHPIYPIFRLVELMHPHLNREEAWNSAHSTIQPSQKPPCAWCLQFHVVLAPHGRPFEIEASLCESRGGRCVVDYGDESSEGYWQTLLFINSCKKTFVHTLLDTPASQVEILSEVFYPTYSKSLLDIPGKKWYPSYWY